MKATWIIPAVVVSLVVFGMSREAKAAPIEWDFTGSGGIGTFGNSLTFTEGGVTATATAWSYETDFQPSRLGQWSTGLGSCGAGEGSCSVPAHQVDNIGQHDYVLVQFSAPINPTSVTIDPYGTWDRDVSYWTGNVASSTDLTGKEYSDLGGLGFLTRIDNQGTASSAPRDVPISNPSLVNTLLIGTMLNGGENDRYKMTSMSANVPIPSTLPLLGVGMLGLAWFQRKRQSGR